MGVTYEWADDNHFILNIKIEFPWTLNEYIQEMKTVMPMIRDQKHPCATIVDTRNMGPLPKDGNIVQILVGIEKQMPDNLFASAVVGMNLGVTTFMNILTSLRPSAKRRAIFAKTMEEAQEKILARHTEIYGIK